MKIFSASLCLAAAAVCVAAQSAPEQGWFLEHAPFLLRSIPSFVLENTHTRDINHCLD